MKTHSIRQGQTEIGIISHNGQDHAAIGSSVNGEHVTGYTKETARGICLTRWDGSTMLDCRNIVCGEYRDSYGETSCAIVWQLTHGRFIAGYALGENGMLFRGELIEDTDVDSAARYAREIASEWMRRDDEDESNQAD